MMHKLVTFGVLAGMLLGGLLVAPAVQAQQPPRKDLSKITKEDVMRMSYDDLIEMDLEDLMNLAEKVGISSDELLSMALNRSASIASKKNESVFDSPLTTYVISREDIENSGATTIAELFRMVPGAIVRQKSNGNYDVTFRGLDNVPPQNPLFTQENSTLLLMIDNRTVYSYMSGGIYWESLPISIDEIERIDVVVGAASALYGPNATTGVINIITIKDAYKPSAGGKVAVGPKWHEDLTATFSTNFAKGWSVRVNGWFNRRKRMEKDMYSYLTIQKKDVDELRDFFGQKLFHEDLHAHRLNSLLRYGGNVNLYYGNEEDDLRFRISYGMQSSGATTVSYDNYVTPFSFRRVTSQFGESTFHYKRLRAHLTYNGGTMDLSRLTTGAVIPKFDYYSFGANFGGDFDVFSWMTVQPEVSFQHMGFDDLKYIPEPVEGTLPRQGYLNGKVNYTLLSGSLRFDMNPIRQLRIVFGLRNDFYSESDRQAPSMQFVVVYSPTENHNIRLNASRAKRGLYAASLFANVNRAPLVSLGGAKQVLGPLWPNSAAHPGTPIYFLNVKGNKELSAPNLDLLELGYRWRISPRYQVDAVGFYNRMVGFDAPSVDSVVVQNHNDPKQTITDFRSYRNLSLVAQQYGGTLNVTAVPIDILTLKAWVTYQHTQLSNYNVPDGNKAILNPTTFRKVYATKVVDVRHKWTPQLFGGGSFQLTLLSDRSLTIYGDITCMSPQLYGYPILLRGGPDVLYDRLGVTIRGNASISYRLLPGVTVFGTVQNIGPRQKEYGFADVVQMNWLLGLRMGF